MLITDDIPSRDVIRFFTNLLRQSSFCFWVNISLLFLAENIRFPSKIRSIHAGIGYKCNKTINL